MLDDGRFGLGRCYLAAGLPLRTPYSSKLGSSESAPLFFHVVEEITLHHTSDLGSRLLHIPIETLMHLPSFPHVAGPLWGTHGQHFWCCYMVEMNAAALGAPPPTNPGRY